MMIFDLAHCSRTTGIGGRIKSEPEDFIVEEILQDGTILETDKIVKRDDLDGSYTRFVLQKRQWTTEGAIRRIANALHISTRRFSYAGSKDKDTISTQLASVFQIHSHRLLTLNLRDIQVLGAWSHSDKVKIGDLLGNRFTITVKEPNTDSHLWVDKIYSDLEGRFPNYFGEQRFGAIRRNTHKIGEQIIRGNYDVAADIFLCDYSGETNPEAVNARKNLKESRDYRKALNDFPSHLGLERIMIAHLEKLPRDYANAFRRLPRSILLLFIHAFQSQLFNLLLSERITEADITLENGEYYCSDRLGFPDIRERSSDETPWIAAKIIGYETELNDREKRLLSSLDVKPSDFRIKGIPELSSEGTYRLLSSPLKGFSFKCNRFGFSLPSGSYATMALREFMDTHKNTPQSRCV